MSQAPSAVTALAQAFEHALHHALPTVVVTPSRPGRPAVTRPSTSNDFLVFAMFAQAPTGQARQQGYQRSYATVLHCEAEGCWLVYLDGQYAYRLYPSDAEVGHFVRDLRAHQLALPEHAVEMYRARL